MNIKRRRRLLEILNSVDLSLIQLVGDQNLGFKVWEYSVLLMDYVLAREYINSDDTSLFALTCLFIAYKVVLHHISMKESNLQRSWKSNIKETLSPNSGSHL